MNSKAIEFIKNMSYSISSNLVSLIISTIVILIIPKIIGVEEYGYWQLYLFYTSYIGFLHFGWNDGIYLRYGGKEYKKLFGEDKLVDFLGEYKYEFSIPIPPLNSVDFCISNSNCANNVDIYKFMGR